MDDVAIQTAEVRGRLIALEDRMARHERLTGDKLDRIDTKLEVILESLAKDAGAAEASTKLADWVRPFLVAMLGGAGAAALMHYLGLVK